MSAGMFGPLNFKEYKPENLLNSAETPCLLCDNVFNLQLCFDVFLKHLFEVHYLVIEDVQNIYSLERYISHWKERFQKTSIESIIPSVKIDCTTQKYFLLSTLMKEDKELRYKLGLEQALQMQEKERTELHFKKQCLFCRLEHDGTRYDYLKHISEQHNLQLGNPQNLVFIDSLLDKIESKLTNLQCIYCEKSFPDRQVLKEHMRKKIHKRINPKNTEYDRYYMVNYLEDRARRGDRDDDVIVDPADQNSDSEYSDWQEGEDSINCLFCAHAELEINKMCLHMHTVHRFNFPQLAAHLDFYQRVKLVNYIRRQVHALQCPTCGERKDTLQELEVHLRTEKHCTLPETGKFDQPEFYFPTYENDTFLYYLEDLDD